MSITVPIQTLPREQGPTGLFAICNSGLEKMRNKWKRRCEAICREKANCLASTAARHSS
jgi:hypothetical protein